MRVSRRHVLMSVLLLLCIALSAPTLYEQARLNRISLDTVRSFHAQGVSVMDLGLRLEYGERVSPGPLAAYASTANCETNPRLSLRNGVVQMLNGNLEAAARCFSATLTTTPDAPDALILAVSAYHLTGQESASRATFEKLPKAAQGIASIAALAIFDYVPTAMPPAQETLGANQLGNIVPRRVLFDLMFYKPEIAWRFLERTVQAGILSEIDRSDLRSIESWQERSKPQPDAVNEPSVPAVGGNQQHRRALRRSLAASIGCAEDTVELGSDLLPHGLFDQSHDLDAWRVLPWTTGGGTFNLGGFMSGMDAPDGGSGVSALRISGLWKTDDPKRYPASGSLELARSVKLLAGNNLYMMLVRYKTENMRSGQTDLWFDSADYTRFVGVWRLPPSDGVWQELYALGYVHGDVAPVVSPLIGHSALGTTWIDYLQIMPVHLKQCDLGGRTTLFGKVLEQDR